MAINFCPFALEILRHRGPLEDPKHPGAKIKITSDHKIVFAAICSILNPLLDRNTSQKSFDYLDVHKECNVPIPTIKKVMPVLLFNFPQYFKVVDRKMSKGYTYEFTWVILKASGTGTDEIATIKKFLRELKPTDFVKWDLFNRVPLQYENKRLKLFTSFQQNDFNYWERNISWAITQKTIKGWAVVPNAWMWSCLKGDYGYNKLPSGLKRVEIVNTPGMKELENRGLLKDFHFNDNKSIN